MCSDIKTKTIFAKQYSRETFQKYLRVVYLQSFNTYENTCTSLKLSQDLSGVRIAG